MELRFKEYANRDEVFTTAVAEVNGKSADTKYIPDALPSRPCFGYDAKIDPNVSSSIRNVYVDVPELSIPNKNLVKGKMFVMG